MAIYEPTKEHLRHSMLFLFNLKKTAAESHRLIVEAYGDLTPSQDTFERWFNRFKKGDFDLKDKERPGQPKKFEDSELEALLVEDNTQTQKQLAKQLNVSQHAICDYLNKMGKIQVEGKWIPHELNERMMEKRKTICEILLRRQQRKSFLHRIITGDEKWIYFDNRKRKRSWVYPGQPANSFVKRNIHEQKALLCIWWDQKGVIFYEILKPGETVNSNRYTQQLQKLNMLLKQKRPEWIDRHDKVILLHDNARPHVSKSVKELLEMIRWDTLPHPPYSPDMAPSDYFLFRSMTNGLRDIRFNNYEDITNWLEEWISSKEENFFTEVFISCQKFGQMLYLTMGNIVN